LAKDKQISKRDRALFCDSPIHGQLRLRSCLISKVYNLITIKILLSTLVNPTLYGSFNSSALTLFDKA
jgi:hypothetical protein